MPSNRRTIPELEFLSALLDRREPPGFGTMGMTVGDYDIAKAPIDKIRRTIAAKEMSLLREEAVPGLGRQAERDRIRRTLGLKIKVAPHLWFNPEDPDGSGVLIEGSPRFNPRTYNTVDDFESEMMSDAAEAHFAGNPYSDESLKKIELQALQEKARRAAPLLLNRTSRRDFLRLLGSPLKKAAINATPVAPVVNAMQGQTPLLLKFLKAAISRKFKGPL